VSPPREADCEDAECPHEIFWGHGDPKRLRTAELSHWTGKAVAAPCSAFEDVVGREESGNSCVDFLTGNDPEAGKPAQACGIHRCSGNHERSCQGTSGKAFWDQIVYVISQDETLTNAPMRSVERRHIDPARHASRALGRNGQNSGATRPESDRADLVVFLEHINQVLPVLGVEVVASAASQAGAEAEEGLATVAPEQAAWPGRGIDASG
jgi:hypothetical protein